MRHRDLKGPWIDGAVPRTQHERIERLNELIELLDGKPVSHEDESDDVLDEIEMECIDIIDERLPEGLCIVCENGGDVIITDEDEDGKESN